MGLNCLGPDLLVLFSSHKPSKRGNGRGPGRTKLECSEVLSTLGTWESSVMCRGNMHCKSAIPRNAGHGRRKQILATPYTCTVIAVQYFGL
jgi:hypothetical protein